VAEIKHTEAFDLAYRFVTETNLNVFLTGKAGTGKTTFLKYLRQHSFKKMVVAAPTGIAAINAGGITLHSLFQLPFAPYVPSSKNTNTDGVNSHSLLSQIRYSKEKLNIFRNLELLVIDEASMVASHTVDAIDTLLKSLRRRYNEPFGGVQVLFVGDLHQLPPVVKNHEWEFLKKDYPSIFFFDSIVLRQHIPVMVELKEIFRQQDNTFINVLNGIRNNNLSKEDFDLLNSRLKPNYSPIENEGYITLTTHNNQADTVNKKKLENLPVRSKIFEADIHSDFPEHIFPAEKALELKVGAQVMFLKNDTEGKQYFNGKIGIITSLTDNSIKVKCTGDKYEIDVKKYEWKNTNYSVHPDTREIIENELGSFVQYPLRLAWAITIHKSQGLTFNKLIIDAENAFANGQVYVALSRCTSLEGLVLTSPVNQSFLGAHHSLKEWQGKNQDDKNLPGKFNDARQEFILQELQTIFSFNSWQYELRNLFTVFKEHEEGLPSSLLTWFNELSDSQKKLQEVADKFKEQIARLAKENSIVEENEPLQQRIKDASGYFSAELLKWKQKFYNHSISTDKKKISKKMDVSLTETAFVIHEMLHRFNHCKNGFILDDYLKNGKKATVTSEKVESSYAQSQSREIIAEGTMHEELYERIAALRKQIVGKTNLPLYTVFSNSAIQHVCVSLPLNKESLLKVKGFGKAKVKQYGDEVLELVREYCDENNLQPQEIFEKKEKQKAAKKEKQGSTIEETIKYFKQGKNIDEIALERDFAISTIEGHLAEAIKLGSIRIEELMPIEEVNTIAKYFPAKPEAGTSLKTIKENIPEDISYGKLKIVLAWLLR